MQVSQRIPAMANNFRPRIQIPRGTAFPILEVGHSKAVNKWEGLLSSLVESNCHVGIPVQQALSYMTRYCANSTCQISLVARPFTGRVTDVFGGEREFEDYASYFGKIRNYRAPNWEGQCTVAFTGTMPNLHTVPSKGIDVTYFMKQALSLVVRNCAKKNKQKTDLAFIQWQVSCKKQCLPTMPCR